MPGSATVQRGNEQLAMLMYLPSVTVPNVAANTSANQTVTVPGVISGDLISWNQQSTVTGLSVSNVYVSSVNTLTFTWANSTVAAINATPAQPFVVEVTRSENATVSGLSGLPNAVT